MVKAREEKSPRVHAMLTGRDAPHISTARGDMSTAGVQHAGRTH